MNELTIVESGLKFKFKFDHNGIMKCYNHYPMLPPALVSKWREKAANEAVLRYYAQEAATSGM